MSIITEDTTEPIICLEMSSGDCHKTNASFIRQWQVTEDKTSPDPFQFRHLISFVVIT
jgi:hypothetical protein